MVELPRGTVTFLFTDIEGSTALWEQDRAAMRVAVDRHLTILQSLIAAHHGVLYKTIGDGTQIAFASAEDALRAAVAAQRALLQETWADSPGVVRVRMALHAGEAVPDERGDYLAATLHRLSRLLTVGHGGQILLTQAVQQLTRGALPAGAELRDLGEHRLRDLLEPERVFQLLHPELLDQFPPLASLDTHPTNLPRQPTPFLGREREVGEISALLHQPEVQLLTLTGAGGTGKTRLALQAAAELLDAFPDGVFFVPLASLTDAALVPAAIMTALGVREEGGQPLLERLATLLASKHLLLVIDNWEHLLDGAPVLAELLRAAPVTVLATSRAPLHLLAEREYPVPPLALPRRQPPPSLEQLSQYEAVRLFIARAQAVKPDFAIDNESAPAVAEICHRLDGLPLAIELAAARLRLLPPQAILNRLEQRLPLLTGGARDAPVRQQTLRQAIAWSYDLLSADEQTLYRRLAVFTGGFSFEAAEVVANPERDLDILAGVSELIDQSLVQQADDAGGEARFMMLETIREFGLEQLAVSDEVMGIHQSHATYFLALAEEGEGFLRSREQFAWLDRLEAEHPNLRAAISWLREQGELVLALRLAGALGRVWEARGYVQEGRGLLDALLAVAPHDGSVPPGILAKALSWAGTLAWMQGDFDAAFHRHQEALGPYQEAGDEWGMAFSLNCMGDQLFTQGDAASAEPLVQDALRRFRALDDARGLVFTLTLVGHMARERGDLNAAEAAFRENLARARASGDPEAIAMALCYLGGFTRERGDSIQAQVLLEEAMALLRERGSTLYVAYARYQLGFVVQAKADHASAIAHFVDVFGMCRDLGDRLGYAQCVEGMAPSLVVLGEPERAARLLGAAERLRQSLSAPIPPSEATAVERAVAAARAALGDSVFDATWAAGGSLSVEQVIAEALTLLPNRSAAVLMRV